jgi:2-dehydropantoate 2-reductase
MACDRSPRICIYGAGAVGGTIGARLGFAGIDVSVVARGETLKAIRREGLTLISDSETRQVIVKVSPDPIELGPQDYVIISVKAPALRDIVPRIQPLLEPETGVVTAMNGVPWWFFSNDNAPMGDTSLAAIDPDGELGRAIPAENAIGCVVYLAATIERPGVIRHSFGNRLVIGEGSDRLTQRLRCLGDCLRRAGFECVETTDIRREIWVKLWGNLSTNPISLLTEATLDQIVGDPLVRTLVRRMMEEAERVGAAIGIKPKISVNDMIATAQGFGAIRTSMLQDLERGTPVEIDALLTVVHDIGVSVGVATPFIDSVLGLARLRAAQRQLSYHEHDKQLTA